MSPADAAWLQMDQPANRMIITALFTFGGRLEPKAVEGLLWRMAAIPRFHQRVMPAGFLSTLPEWRDDPRFDLRAHVRHTGLPAPGGEAGLRLLVSERMGTALDPEKPLWEVDVIDRGGSTALLARVHHCIGDGVSLVRALLGLADDPDPLPREMGRHPHERALGPLEWAARQLVRARTFAELLALPPDPPTPFRRRLGLVKRAAWSGPIPLARVRALAREHHATVNDVLMGMLAGVLRGWLIEAGHRLPDRDIRALVPVFLGSRDGAGLGNRFGLAFVELPVGEPDPGERLRRLKERMDGMKSSAEAPVAFDVLRTLGVAGALVERIGVEIFSRKATVMVTNVPGPRARIHLAGGELESLMVWAPTSGRLGFSVTLLSYGGELRIGVAADAHIEADPQALVERFERELASVPQAARTGEATLRPG